MKRRRYKPGSAKHLDEICQAYDAFTKPRLTAIAAISAPASGTGLFSQFTDPTFVDALFCVAISFALFMMISILWKAAWELPFLFGKSAALVFAPVAILGFLAYASVSIPSNLSATTGQQSADLVQQDRIDALDNAGQQAAFYVDQLRIARDALSSQADLAREAQAAEIAGAGPTGDRGKGPVSDAFGASGGKYDQAVLLLDGVLTQADAHIDAFVDLIGNLRATQIDPTLDSNAKETRLKALSGKAIGEMRALLALDPARALRAAASIVAVGVPPRSQANSQSQARIAEITQAMQLYADQLLVEADRIAALAPEVPKQVTLSTAERLLQTLWRTPAWTAVALLLDVIGWVGVGLRVALYQSRHAREVQEAEDKDDFTVTPDDIERIERFWKRADQVRTRMTSAKATSKRQRKTQTSGDASPDTPKAPQKKQGPIKRGKDQRDD